MNKQIKIETLISEEEIQKAIQRIALEIMKQWSEKDIVIVGVLKGASLFTADLMRTIKMDLELDFIEISSYKNGTESGTLTFIKDIQLDIHGKTVIIVEDIIDTGKTMRFLADHLLQKGAKEIKICSLLSKPSRRETEVQIDYLGFEIQNEFVIGYGMDYAEKYRNLPFIGKIIP